MEPVKFLIFSNTKIKLGLNLTKYATSQIIVQMSSMLFRDPLRDEMKNPGDNIMEVVYADFNV